MFFTQYYSEAFIIINLPFILVFYTVFDFLYMYFRYGKDTSIKSKKLYIISVSAFVFVYTLLTLPIITPSLFYDDITGQSITSSSAQAKIMHHYPYGVELSFPDSTSVRINIDRVPEFIEAVNSGGVINKRQNSKDMTVAIQTDTIIFNLYPKKFIYD